MMNKITFFNRFFCPQDMIGLLRSNLGIFWLQKFGVYTYGRVYIDLPGVVICQHIHPSTLLSYTEKRVDKIPAAAD